MTAPLPNVRKLFIPDPGYTIADADLSGADAQVVAWEAEDAELKQAFRDGLKVHILNCRTMFPALVKGWSDEAIKSHSIYKKNKQAVHATNYGAHFRTVATTNGWTAAEAENFQNRWFSAHPGIRRWHHRVEHSILTKRMVANKFGYTRTYFDRVDQLLPEGLAWIPQSTVALVSFAGALNLKRNLPEVIMLIQVHDSLVFQYPTEREAELLPKIKQELFTVVPYDDPLTIPWGLKTSTKSWGHCEDKKWPKIESNPGVVAATTAPA